MKSIVFLIIFLQFIGCDPWLIPTATTHAVTTMIEDEKGVRKYSQIIATETVYTTVIETPSPIIIHTMTDSGSGAQQQEQPESSATEEEITESQESHQSAIKKMIMILSLVGGLGVVAVVVTALIFTRIRAKNKRKRMEAMSSSTEIEQPELLPSAPPPVLMAASPVQRRHIPHVSPSAPTAKELDGVIDADEGSSRPVVPEGPPPAYTPSAPPHYALDLPSRRHSLSS